MNASHKLDDKKVVIGFTGRIDSIVAAYLLKKQGFEVMGVSVLFSPREKEEGLLPILDENDQEIEVPYFCVNDIADLEKVQKQAIALGISFYAVDASAEYCNKINDRIIASRYAGVSYNPELDAHALLISILHQKADLLQAKYISTGHYAKLSSATGLQKTRLLTSNDLENDQSGFLVKVDSECFSRLKLPLADMRKNEVIKVASTLAMDNLAEKKPWRELMSDPAFTLFVQKRIAPSLIRKGQVIEYMNDTYVCDHEGIHQFFCGEGKLKKKLLNSIEKDFVIVDILYKGGVVIIMKKEHCKCETLVISNLSIDKDTDISRTLNCYVTQVDKNIKIKGRLVIKNNEFAQFDFPTPVNECFSRGESVIFLSHDREGAKVLGHGEITSFGIFDNGKLLHLPLRDDELGDNLENKPFSFAF